MRSVVLFARAPSAPGKTRLTAHLSPERARELREALLLDTLDAARATGEAVIISFTPLEARGEMAELVGPADLIAQRGEDLGDRMHNAMTDAFDRGARPVALLGSDLPSLSPDYVLDAFAMLDSGADIVLGPSDDGGFYLVAAHSPAPDMFAGIDWSTRHVLDDVVTAAHCRDATIGFLRPCRDVDVPEDLVRLTEELVDTAVARRVRAWCADRHRRR